jgi:hypothetical protein
VDGTCGTYGHALTTDAALLVVNVADIVLNLNSFELTLLLALATTDTGGLTSLHGYRPFVLVDTRNEHATPLRTLFAKLDDVTRTCLDASATSHTLFFIDLRQTRLRIHVDGIKLASCHTVATA